MQAGKPAGIACAQLDAASRCALFGSPLRPHCCSGLQASLEMCGASRTQALAYLQQLERLTAPA